MTSISKSVGDMLKPITSHPVGKDAVAIMWEPLTKGGLNIVKYILQGFAGILSLLPIGMFKQYADAKWNLPKMGALYILFVIVYAISMVFIQLISKRSKIGEELVGDDLLSEETISLGDELMGLVGDVTDTVGDALGDLGETFGALGKKGPKKPKPKAPQRSARAKGVARRQAARARNLFKNATYLFAALVLATAAHKSNFPATGSLLGTPAAAPAAPAQSYNAYRSYKPYKSSYPSYQPYSYSNAATSNPSYTSYQPYKPFSYSK